MAKEKENEFELGDGILEDLEDEQLRGAQGGRGHGPWGWGQGAGGQGWHRGWGNHGGRAGGNGSGQGGQAPQLVEQGVAPQPVVGNRGNGRG